MYIEDRNHIFIKASNHYVGVHKNYLLCFLAHLANGQVSLCCGVLSGVRLSSFSFKRLQLKNGCTECNQLWFETSLWEGESILYK